MNFDAQIDRNQFPTMKWSRAFLEEHFGNADAIPMSVADMDFQSPPAVISIMNAISILLDHHSNEGDGVILQSPVFGLLGANVTVVDLTRGQLDGDGKAATHYGYPITTVQADMRDLSALPDDAFDLVFQADSLAYVPDLRQVYSEVARVLRPGGLYRVKHSQPAMHRIEWNGRHYMISVPLPKPNSIAPTAASNFATTWTTFSTVY